MKKNMKTVLGLTMAIAAPMAVQSSSPAPTEQSQSVNKNKQEAIVEPNIKRGQGIQISDYGGLDFDYPKMFQHASPIFDPKRPHPIQSYQSQQRAAKKRRKAN